MMSLAIDLFFPVLDGPTDEEVEEAQEVVDARKAAEEKRKNGALIRCPFCSEVSKLSNLVYIQTYWYTEPYGCNGGDYWCTGEGRSKCIECDKELRFNYSPEIEKLKTHFKRIEDVHQR